jgi:hypothetical protein
MIRRLALALAALAVCQTAAAQEPAPYRLVDLSDDFAAFYDRTEGMDGEARIAAFKTDIVPLFPQFYGRERFSDMDDAAYDTRIRNAIRSFPQGRLVRGAAVAGPCVVHRGVSGHGRSADRRHPSAQQPGRDGRRHARL